MKIQLLRGQDGMVNLAIKSIFERRKE